MQYLPVCLNLQSTPVLLVGGGTVATRKATLLARAGARLTVVAPGVTDELRDILSDTGGRWQQKLYSNADLHGQHLVVAATPVAEVNLQVYRNALEKRLPINVVDAPDLCTFIFPAIVDRDPVLIAISSSGASPVLARQLRRKIEAMVPANFGKLANFAARWRNKVKSAITDESARRLFWEQTVEGGVAELVLTGREEAAERELVHRLKSPDDLYRGEVYLIGAGPGDPDLMTFKALRLLQSADIVLYDRLVNPKILDMARRDAERIYVGKKRAAHSLPQQEINTLLLDLAQQGKRVARLKGGDPFIFGRGGEEIQLLAEHNINFQVVPGITAANGAACYAGIPLTHRDHAQSVRFAAGYLKGDRVEHEWQQFSSSAETIVFYMGLIGLPVICAELQKCGRSADTPVALIAQGTLPEQRVLIGTLSTMVELVEREQPQAPTLIIVGDVVRLHRELEWFNTPA